MTSAISAVSGSRGSPAPPALGCGAGMNYTRTSPLEASVRTGVHKGDTNLLIVSQGEDKRPAKPNRPKAEGGRAGPAGPRSLAACPMPVGGRVAGPSKPSV